MGNQLEQQILEMVELKSSSDSLTVKKPLRILHVDDDACMLQVSKQILMMMESDFEIDCAGSVDEAYGKLHLCNYDVIVSDYEMPQKNGLDFLRQLRELKDETPFILFTGRGREEVAIKALNLGADGYFNKQGSPETVYGELAHGIRMITERKKAKQLLKESEQQIEAIVLNAPIGIATCDSNTYFLSANESFCEILGYSTEQLRRLTIKDILYTEDTRESLTNMKKLTSGRLPFFRQERRFVTKNATLIDGRITVCTILNKEKKPTLFVFELEDITKLKKTELEMQERYEILERITEGVGNGCGIAIIGQDYQVKWANAVLRKKKVSSKKKCYQTFADSDTVCPDCGVKKIFEKKVPFDVHEYKFTDSEGKVAWVELRVTPLKDKEGNISAAIELAVPITERKKAEEKLCSANEELRVTGGLTRHNVRNKLAVIKFDTYLLSKKFGSDPQAAEYLSSIESAIANANDLLNFSSVSEKIGAEEPREINVERSFDEAVALFPQLKGIKILNECKGLTVVADSLLTQLFYYLIDNSLKHGERVTAIWLQYVEYSGIVMLFYEDDGVGVPAANKLRIFEEGFSTAASAGLGLTLVRKMANVYGWTINEEGAPGKGAKFAIAIPLTTGFARQTGT